MTYYKYLNMKRGKITSEHGKQTWKIGQEYSVKGDIIKCKNGFHASKQPLDALNYVKGDVLAIVSVSGDCDNDTDKVCYRTMKIERAYKWTQKDSVTLAIFAAEQVIKIYEDKYPNDSCPRDAIKAAKAYLKDPTKKNRDAADASADAAATAGYNASAYAAASAAYAAAAASAAAYASSAASSAYAAAAAAAYAAAAASAYASPYASYAASANAEMTAKINRKMKAMVKHLEAIQ